MASRAVDRNVILNGVPDMCDFPIAIDQQYYSLYDKSTAHQRCMYRVTL